MTLPQVAQSQLLSDVFAELLKKYTPQSVAVLGCAGGNGFERISTAITGRVVGIDVNPHYIEQVYSRFHHQIPILELFAHEIQSDCIRFKPVDLVFAGLFLEYVNVDMTLKRIHSWLNRDGIMGILLQLPHPTTSAVTQSPIASMKALAGAMRLIPPEEVSDLATVRGFRMLKSSQLESPAGKRFQLLTFRRMPLI